jgi:hypothetical protein
MLYKREYIRCQKKIFLSVLYDWLSSKPRHNERHEAVLGVPSLKHCVVSILRNTYCCFKKDGSSPASPRMTTMIMVEDDIVVSTVCSKIC